MRNFKLFFLAIFFSYVCIMLLFLSSCSARIRYIEVYCLVTCRSCVQILETVCLLAVVKLYTLTIFRTYTRWEFCTLGHPFKLVLSLCYLGYQKLAWLDLWFNYQKINVLIRTILSSRAKNIYAMPLRVVCELPV